MTEREYKINSVLLVAAFLALCGYVAITWNDGINLPDKGHPQIKKWVNKEGDSVTSLKGTAEQFAAREKHIRDSIAAVYGIREKNLLEYIIAIQQQIADIKPTDKPAEKDYEPVTNPDCPPVVKNMRKEFKNSYYTVQAQIGDSNYLHLRATDTITVLWKWVKEGSLFNRKRFLQVDLSNANPYTSTTGLTAYKVPGKRPKKWGIGLQAGYGFSPGSLKPEMYVGVGISYNLIRL